jgi:hypothetical protein
MKFTHLIISCFICLFLINCKVKKSINPNLSELDLSSLDRCPKPPPQAVILNLQSFLLSRIYDDHLILSLDSNNSQSNEKQAINYSSLEGKVISTKKEFTELLHLDENKVNWKKNNVFIYAEFNSYKNGKLDSDKHLSALAQYKKTLFICFTSTFHGVCQGIEQIDDLFTSSYYINYVIIPKNLTNIKTIMCNKGPDCSGIP